MLAARFEEEIADEAEDEDEDPDKAAKSDCCPSAAGGCCCGCCGCWSLLPCFFPARRCPRPSSTLVGGAPRRLLLALLAPPPAIKLCFTTADWAVPAGATTAGARRAGNFFCGVLVVAPPFVIRVEPPDFLFAAAAAVGAAVDGDTAIAVASEDVAAGVTADVVAAGGSRLTFWGDEGLYSSSLLLSVDALLLALLGEWDRSCA